MNAWFSKTLINWYNANKRDLPWRNIKDPYKIWLSEIILQQTQVVQGTSYYLKFIQHFPTVFDLAKAKEDEVLKHWQGLGYYSRARNLLVTAKNVAIEMNGRFPQDFEKLKQLKGIGDYTAAAIASFAFDLPHAVVDGNVYRFLSRIFEIKTPIDSSEGKKEFATLAKELLDKKNPASFNQAIMEFGSQYCKPIKPNCQECVFSNKCLAFKNNLVETLPIKSKKVKQKNRFFNYLIIIDKKENILVEQRGEKDIWQSLYQFPLFESKKSLSLNNLLNQTEIKKKNIQRGDIVFTSNEYKHILSHQILYAKFYVVKLKNKLHPKKYTIHLSQLTKLAFPRLIEKFMNEYFIK